MKRDACVLVLGAGGFIGRHLCHALAQQGLPVLAATRQPSAFAHPMIENISAGFTDPTDFIPLLLRSSSVIHAASASTPGSSMATPQIDGNLRTTLALIEALQSCPGRRVLYLSSAGTLYGERATAAVETDPLRPRSYHGAGKAAAEQFLHAWATQYEGTAVVLRPTNVYGPGQSARTGFAIVPTAMACAATQQLLEIWGDGTQLRDYLYVEDLIDLCLKAICTAMPSGCHVYNAASGQAVTVNHLLSLVEATSGRHIRRKYGATRPSDIRHIAVDAGAARIALDWHATTALARGLAATWNWHQAQE